MNLAAAPTAESAPVAGLDKLGKRAQPEHKTVDIFKGKSWYVAPPKPKPVPPPPPPPPPPPTAPPMPYAYMGSYLGKDGRMIIFLTRGDQVYSVSPGDVLEGTYRVEGIAVGSAGSDLSAVEHSANNQHRGGIMMINYRNQTGAVRADWPRYLSVAPIQGIKVLDLNDEGHIEDGLAKTGTAG